MSGKEEKKKVNLYKRGLYGRPPSHVSEVPDLEYRTKMPPPLLDLSQEEEREEINGVLDMATTTQERHEVFEIEGTMVLPDQFEDIGPKIILLGTLNRICMEVTNSGTKLKDFRLMIKPHENSSFVPAVSGKGFGTTGANMSPLVMIATDDVDELEDGEVTVSALTLPPVHSIKFQAKINSGSTTVGIRGSITRV